MPVNTIHGGYSASDATLRVDDYFGNILYENGTAEDAAHHPITKVLTPEGYVDYTTAWKPYCYYRQDHLGSIREVDSYTGNNRTVVQKTQYYPSGTPFAESFGAGEQAYKFTGKEMITMHGLNWQDFGARWLDNARMQWTSVDPLAEKYYSISPYAYCAGNPVRYVDVQGKWIQDSKGGHAYRHGQWSNNTSMGTRIIGNDMQKTPIGRTQFNTLNNNESTPYPVKLTLDPGNGASTKGEGRNAGYHYKTKNGKIVSAELIIYKGAAEEIFKRVNSVVNNPNAVVRADADADDKARVANPPKTVDEVIGQEAVHESGHLTRPNLKDNTSEDQNIKESDPNALEIESIKQTPEVRIEKIQIPVEGI